MAIGDGKAEILEWMAKHKITHDRLAQMSGLSRSSIAHIMKPGGRLRKIHVLAIEQASFHLAAKERDASLLLPGVAADVIKLVSPRPFT